MNYKYKNILIKMRLLLTFSPTSEFSYDCIDKHSIQGLIYSLLGDTEYGAYHDLKRFKFFTFSDIFPIGDFKPGESKNLLISSPDERFIRCIENSLKDRNILKFRDCKFEIQEYKPITLKLKNKFISGSPIVLYKDNRKNLYFSFRRDKNLDFFLERLRDNAIKKYNAFYSTDFSLEGNIFDRLKFKKEVAVKLRRRDKEFIIIGNVWRLLEKFRISEENRKFYSFIMDCGLGEKNSLGFGFINPIR